MNRTLEYNVSQAVERHHDASELIASVADELPSKQGARWRNMADVLKKCDVPAAQRLANLDARCWFPLFASERGDPRLLERVLSVIEKPQQTYSFYWAALAYPVMILGFASATLFLLSLVVLPLFHSLFDDFGLQLPFMTVAMFKVVTFFSGWLKFKGGKGVATYIGFLFGLNPYIAILFLLVWLVTAFVSKYSSLGSLIGILVAPAYYIFINFNFYILIFFIYLTLIIYLKHTENIKRLINKTESKIKLSK